ncbi:hypothetical protein ACIQGZ_17415 [Streptomyces sp. NPDC092296]|uniref:hypothetical protein n=1 Tax=Streptomyces sp. NPDC092296 TaxID=3366012 RepID=UPI00381B3792
MTDFFAPGTTYLIADPYKAPEIRPEFRCVAVAVHPSKGDDRAFGFYRRGSTSPWRSCALTADDWASGWTALPPADAPALDYDDGLGPCWPTSEELRLVVRAAARAALTVFARTVPLDPAGRGEYFRGLHAASTGFRAAYTSAPWWDKREPAIRQWLTQAAAPTSETEEYRESFATFTAQIARVLDGDPMAIRRVLDDDLPDMPLESLR